MFLFSKMIYRKKLLFIFFGQKMLLEFCHPALRKSDISTLRNDKRIAKWEKFCCFHCFTINK